MNLSSKDPILSWNNKPINIDEKKFIDINLYNNLDKEASKVWNNLLIKSDNSAGISSLLNSKQNKLINKNGGVKLIYIDPPYLTKKNQLMLNSSSKEIAYKDKYNNSLSEYLSEMYIHLNLIKKILSDDGSVYVHLDYRTSSYIKVIMDEIFGASNLKGYLIWNIDNGAKSRKFWSNQHNDVLVYSKSDKFTFNHQSEMLRTNFSDSSLKTHFTKKDKDGRFYRERNINNKSYKYFADDGKLVGSVWNDIKSMKANSPIMEEYTSYPTQKPLSLLNRIISASSSEGEIVMDTFCGSGTSLVVAENLDRKWIGIDFGNQAISICKDRLKQNKFKLI